MNELEASNNEVTKSILTILKVYVGHAEHRLEVARVLQSHCVQQEANWNHDNPDHVLDNPYTNDANKAEHAFNLALSARTKISKIYRFALSELEEPKRLTT